MSNPQISDVKVNKIMKGVSTAYRNKSFIADLIAPTVKVVEKAGKIAKYGKDNLRLPDDASRAPGTRAKSFEYTVSQVSYACEEKAQEHAVPDEMLKNQDDPYDAYRDATMFAIDRIAGIKENALATYMANTSNLTSNITLSSTDQWSDYANSEPIDDVLTGHTTMQGLVGTTPNTFVCGFETYVKLLNHPAVTERVKYVGIHGEEAVRQAMANLFNVEQVLIGDSIKNTANQGQTDSLSNIWGKHAWLVYVPKRPSIMQSAFMYTFSDVPREVDRYREEAKKQDVIRVRESYDQQAIDVEFAYLIKNAVA